MATPRRAILYCESLVQPADKTVKLLTSGPQTRDPETTLGGKQVDIQAGTLWVTKMPELFLDKTYEAFMEVTVASDVLGSGKPQISHPFKLEMTKVGRNSECVDIAGFQMLSGVQVGKTGITFRIALSELDKVNRKKLNLVKQFVKDNQLAELATKVAASTSMPINAADIVKVLFNTVELVDALNEDDLVWTERPKIDLRRGTEGAGRYPLYRGWYAFVASPEDDRPAPPVDLLLSGEKLYRIPEPNGKMVPYKAETYFTWNTLSAPKRARQANDRKGRTRHR